MNQQLDWIEKDISFILEECVRISTMSWEELKCLPNEDAFCTVPHPSGEGELICGKEAQKRFAGLSAEAGKRAGLLRSVTRHTLIEPAKAFLIQRFVIENREINRQQIDKYLSSVGRAARRKCSDVTHFVPCTLMMIQEPELFRIGPVTFRNRANFRKIMLNHLANFDQDLESDLEREMARKLMATALTFYRQFDWVAEISVKNADSSTSATTAKRVVTSALDCLHLIFRAKHTHKMHVGGPALRTDRRGGVTIAQDGKLQPHGSVSWAGQASFPEDWSRELNDPHMANLVSLCGIALEVLVDPDLNRPISQRFLDAAQWFGEASRDEQPATKLVKYVTSLERMLMTDEKDNIADLVSARVAALCCGNGASDRQKWYSDAKRIYHLRSRLVHGSLSPNDPEIGDEVWLAAHLGEESLANALILLGKDALKAEKVPKRRLAKWYKSIVAHIDDVEAAERATNKVASIQSA